MGSRLKIIVVIQARMGSTRLPGKVLRPLGRTIVLDWVVTRCRAIGGVDEVAVATSTLDGDDPIAAFCLARGVPCFRGSEDDVLDRYVRCSEPYAPDYVIRVTADCPFVDHDQAAEVVRAMCRQPADIVRLAGGEEQPRGLAVEMISFEALTRIHRISSEPRHREHVTYYAYEFAEEFRATWVEVDPDLRMRDHKLRMTLDTDDDYRLCVTLAAAFPGDLLVPSRRLVRYLVDHPEVAALNAHVQQKPVV